VWVYEFFKSLIRVFIVFIVFLIFLIFLQCFFAFITAAFCVAFFIALTCAIFIFTAALLWNFLWIHIILF